MAKKTKKSEQVTVKLQKRQDASTYVDSLRKLYPEAHCALIHRNAFELLIATILSAQCTDERVNRVTPALFQDYPNAHALSEAPLEKIEKRIGSVNFFRNKAIALKECSKTLVSDYGGEVPAQMEDLILLRGVGRKTANVVLGNAFGIPSMVVDTHVGRLSRRMGLTKKTDPVDVEHDLMKCIDGKDWVLWSHLLIQHGRNRCKARGPECNQCEIAKICPKIL